MNPPCEDIKDILVDGGVGVFQTNLFLVSMPNTPDACVGVFDSPGMPPDLSYNVYDLEYPSVQVRVRGDIFGYEAAWNKAKEVKDCLHGKANETWNGTYYLLIACSAEIMFVYVDENNRPVLSVNFEIHRRT